MKPRPFLRWFTTLFLLISVVGFLLFISDIPQPLQEGTKIPEIQALDEFKGKVILLNFWATWCEPCLNEMPSLEALYQNFKERDFVVVAINRDSRHLETSQKRVELFKKEVPLSFPILYDVDGKISDLFRVSALPVSFIISGEGIILKQIFGSRDWTSQESFAIISKSIE